MMSRIALYTKDWTWADYGVASLLIVFCAFNKLMPILMILSFLSILKVRNNSNSMLDLLSLKLPFIWMIIFFLTHLIGLIYSENVAFGIEDVGMKLSFLLFPAFLISTKLKLTLKQLLEIYLLGLLLAITICYSYAIFRSVYNIEDNNWSYFTESYFSFMMHRSYFGTYLAIGTLLSIIYFFKYVLNKTKHPVLFLIIPFFLFLSTMLTYSKAAIIILIVQLVPLTYYLLTKYSKRIYGLAGVSLLVLAISIVFVTENRIKARFTVMINGLTEQNTVSNHEIESNSSRLIMWSTSTQLIKEKPFLGVGTGDVKDALIKRNIELKNFGVAESKLNSHNQFLNTFVQLGLLGLIPLLLVFITSFRVAIRNRQLVLMVLVTSLFVTMLFESFLETQAGIIPVSLILLTFTLKSLNTRNETTDSHTILPT